MKPPAPTDEAEPSPSPLASGLAALRWSVASGTADQVIAQVRARGQRRRWRRIGIAAASAVALLVAAGQWQPPSAPTAAATPPSLPAIVSLPATQTLSDGSIVELKEGAAIRVEFTPGLRRVVLQTSEAHFQVTKDPSRPFVVVAGGVEVRAVGTAFSVQLGASAVDVLVTEGRVTVAQPAPADSAGATSAATLPPAPPTLLPAGHRMVVELAPSLESSPPPVLAVSTAEQDDRLAWRVPRLEFAGTPLREAIAMFNQHGRTRLSLDPSLGHLQLSGSLRADDIDSLLLLLKNEFGINPERLADQEIRLRRR